VAFDNYPVKKETGASIRAERAPVYSVVFTWNRMEAIHAKKGSQRQNDANCL
jgi:hypothetical protein